MNDLEMWSLLIGAVLPPFVAIIMQPRWPDWFRAVVSVIVSIVAGFVTTYLTNDDLLWEQPMVTSMLMVGVASLTAYRNFWKPTTVAPTIESKTAI